MAISSEKLTLSGADGAELAARLDLPSGPPRASSAPSAPLQVSVSLRIAMSCLP